MVDWLGRLKPGVSRRIHLFLAAGLWTVIGMILLVRGIILLKSGAGLWLIVAGIVLGSIKSRFVLDRVARRGVGRIMQFADNTCIGAVYSWKTWLLVIGMMIMGITLRRLAVAPNAVGTVCVAIGWALILSSRHAWQTWSTWRA